MELKFSRDELRPLIEAVLTELFDRFGDVNRVAYTEPEGGRTLLGKKQHVPCRMPDCEGRLPAAKLGQGYVYTRAELFEFLERLRQREQ